MCIQNYEVLESIDVLLYPYMSVSIYSDLTLFGLFVMISKCLLL